MASGVIYAKVARKDIQGVDNTLSLQELNDLRIKFSDVGIVDYHITNITEYPDYYLYTIATKNITSSLDNNILNHTFSASAILSPSSHTVPGGILNSYTVNSYTVNTDILNYFNASSGTYTYGDTPNVIVTFSASAHVTPSVGSQNISFALSGDSGTTFLTGSTYTITSPTTIKLYGTASFIGGSNLVLGFINLSANSFQVQNIQWSFTQSVAPQTSSNLTVLEPYLTSNFEYSDCNALFNNADFEGASTFYRRVLYDNGSVIPSNYQEILSQSAEFADVKDYYYALRAQVYPRYNGVKVTQQRENVWTSGDISFGKSPSVQTLETYFAYFDWVGGTTPELIGKSAMHVLYLIDKDGNVLTPTLSSSYYYNLIDNFESGKNVNISLASTNGPSNVGIQSVIRAGALPWGIIASQTGSDSTPYPTMSFYSPTTSPPNYISSFTYTPLIQTISPAGSWIELDLNADVGSIPVTNITRFGNYIKILNTSNLTLIAIQVVLDLTFNLYSSIGNHFTNVSLALEESTDNGVSWHLISGGGGDGPFTVNDGQTITRTYTSAYVSPASNNLYRCRVYHTNNVGLLTSNGSTLSVVQNVSPNIAVAYSGSGYEYFTTGSASKNILTGSQFGDFYNQDAPVTQQPYDGSGYYPFYPFSIQNGDQIRFEGDENQVYTIIEVYRNYHSSPLYLKLDRNIVDGTDLNSFLIRRFKPDPNFITLDWNLNTYTGGGGFIFPQYITNELQQNFDTIVKNLKEKGLIN